MATAAADTEGMACPKASGQSRLRRLQGKSSAGVGAVMIGDVEIAAATSSVRVAVIVSREDLVIARAVRRLLANAAA